MTAPKCFYVHRNGSLQYMYNNQYNRLMFTHVDMNDDDLFDLSQSRWIAPGPGRIHLSGQSHVLNGLRIAGPVAALKFILNSNPGNVPPAAPNGSDMFSPIGSPFYCTATGTGGISGDGWWKVCEGDKIELACFSFSASGYHEVVIDGHRAHTYCSGAFFPA